MYINNRLNAYPLKNITNFLQYLTFFVGIYVLNRGEIYFKSSISIKESECYSTTISMPSSARIMFGKISDASSRNSSILPYLVE